VARESLKRQAPTELFNENGITNKTYKIAMFDFAL
jgi:hypothetical protein